MEVSGTAALPQRSTSGSTPPVAALATAAVAGGLSLRPSLNARTGMQQLGLLVAALGAGYAAGSVTDGIASHLPGDRTTGAFVLAGAGALTAVGLRALPGTRGLAGSAAMTGGAVTAIGSAAAGVASLGGRGEGDRGSWSTLGHAAVGGLAVGAMAVPVALRIRHAVNAGTLGFMDHGVEHLTPKLAPGLQARVPAPAVAGDVADVSGGPGSLVSRASMSTPDRKWADSALSAAHINQLRGGTDAKSPIRIVSPVQDTSKRAKPEAAAVGRTAQEQVDTAMAELHRTKAFERSAIVVGSPASGHPHHASWEAFETAFNGDVASVVAPFGRSPIWFATHKTQRGIDNNTMLLRRISDEIRQLPADQRPRLLTYGESWGAETMKRTLFRGDQMREFGVERALLVAPPRLLEDVRTDAAARYVSGQPGLTAIEVGDAAELDRRVAATGSLPDVVFAGNDTDIVARLPIASVVQRPAHLARDRNLRPEGVPAAAGWSPVSLLHAINDGVTDLTTPGLGHEYSKTRTPALVQRFVGRDLMDDDTTAAVQEYVNRADAARRGPA